MPQQTKIFRVFVSSTFDDMKTERKLLQEKVFPELEKFCRQNGARFQAIDLRWGVSEESQRDQKTMEICLNEIRRCQQITPKPNFLILLGNRYGWQPIPPAIPETEMTALSPHLDAEAQILVDHWYRLDENAVPAEYVLQPRGKRFRDYQQWQSIESQLRKNLRAAALQANFSKDALIKYTTSATHQEIIAGALNPPPEAAAPESHVLALSRSIKNLFEVNEVEEFLDFDDGKPDPYSEKQLENLREELQTKLPEVHFIPYTAQLENCEIILEDEKTFTGRILEHLISVIESELAKVVDEDEIRQEMRYHNEYAEKRALFFEGREEALSRIRAYLDDEITQKSLSIIGPSGSGKTSVMAKAVLQAKERNAVLVYRFIGANANSSNILSLLKLICRQIVKAYGTELVNLLRHYQNKKLDYRWNWDNNQKQLNDFEKGTLLDINILTVLLRECISLARPDKPLVIFLDALDQLFDSDGAISLDWLPLQLPPYVRLVVSYLPTLEGTLKETEYYLLPAMPRSDGEKLLARWFEAENRTLTNTQIEDVQTRFEKNGLPLYLRIVFEQARTWHSYETPEPLPNDVPGIIRHFLSSLEMVHSPLLVSQVVGYILAGRDKGLTEDEILDMISFNKDDPAGYWQYFLKTSHITHREEVKKARKLPTVIWSRLFFDLMPYLTERDSYGERIIGFYHRQFNEILKQKYLQDEKLMHASLSQYFSIGPYFFDSDNQTKPNLRKLVEQPWQQIKAGMWDEVTETLCDLEFIQAKAAAKLTFYLVKEFNDVLQGMLDNVESNLVEKVQIAKYTRDLIACAQAKIRRDELGIPHSLTPCSEQENANKIECMKTNPSRADRLKDYLNFFGQEVYNLQSHASDLPHFTVQQAWNYSAEGPVGEAAKRLLKERRTRLLLRPLWDRPAWKALPAAIKQLNGHTMGVNAVSVTPDGKLALSGSGDNTLILWDLETGRVLRKLELPTECAYSVSMTPDGKRAVSGFSDHSLILWDLETGCIIRKLEGHTDSVHAVSVTPDGKLALSGSWDRTLILWDLETGCIIRKLEGHTHSVVAVSMTPDGKLALSGSWDRALILWDLETGCIIRKLEGHTYSVDAVSMTPDGKRAVSGFDDHSLILWDLETGCIIRKLEGHTDGVNAVSMTPDGKRAVSVFDDHSLILWDLETGCIIRKLEGHSRRINAVSVTPDGKLALSGSDDHTLILWDLITGFSMRKLEENTSWILSVCVAQYRIYALSGSDDNTLILWDLETGHIIRKLEGHTDIVMAVSVTPDGKLALSGSGDNTLILWDLETGHIIRKLEGHRGGCDHIIMTPDGKQALSSETTAGGTLIHWDLETGHIIRKLERHTYSDDAVSMTPDGKRAVLGFGEASLILWDLETGCIIRKLEGHSRRINAVSVTPDGKLALSGSDDYRLILWDLETGHIIRKLEGHSGRINAVSVTPDGKLAVSGSSDNSLILWDLETGRRLAMFPATHAIRMVTVYVHGEFINVCSGGTMILQACRDLLCPGPGIVTARYIWEFETRCFSGPFADCPFCGTRFAPAQGTIETIRAIYRNSGLGPDDSPCLSLPKECWEEPRLLSSCPKCKEALKFNPFLVDPEGINS